METSPASYVPLALEAAELALGLAAGLTGFSLPCQTPRSASSTWLSAASTRSRTT